MCKPDSSRNERTPCAYPNCTKTVWRDANGVCSMYCGASHRDAMAQKMTAENLCQLCRIKPRYIANGRPHSFCGTFCAAKSRRGEKTPSSTAISLPSVEKTCMLDRCSASVYISRDGTPSEWCSHTHRQEAVKRGQAETCLLCSRSPKAMVNDKRSDFCSRKCSQVVMDSAPKILAVVPTDAMFQQVSKQFEAQWKHPTLVPTIIKVWKIYGGKIVNDQFSRYQQLIQRKSTKNNSNTHKRFHGTSRACLIGDKDHYTEFCSDDKCALCRIMESSFKRTHARSRFNFGRFGSGIYTSGTSSKADTYVDQKSVQSSYNAMLLNEVVLGKQKVLTQNTPSLTKPPPGYDSVFGKPGGVLNYDESIVYVNEAIRPLFLIIYQK